LKNFIRGRVATILDGNSFILKLDPDDPNENIVTVSIANRHLYTPSTLSGVLAKMDLQKRLVGRTVNCEIVEHDFSDRIVANINLRRPNEGSLLL